MFKEHGVCPMLSPSLTLFQGCSCIDFDIIRQNFYTASNLKDLPLYFCFFKFLFVYFLCKNNNISFVHAIGLTNKL